MNRKIGAILALALAVVVSCKGCKKGGGDVTPTDGAPAPAPVATPAAEALAYIDERDPKAAKTEGDWLIHTLEGDCGTLNAVLSNSQYEAMVLWYLYRNVIDYDPKLNYIPALAERWEVSEDKKTYTFHLDPRATWEDGKPVSADDFDFTVKTILDPKVDAMNKKALFDGFVSSKVVDAKTYQVTFKQALAGQIDSFASLTLIPKHVYGTGKFADHPANRKPIGNGPFKFVRWETNKLIELERRDDYWGEKPALKKILFKVIPDEAVRLNALKTQEVDEARLSAIQFEGLKNDPAFASANRTLQFFQLSMPNFVAWNNKSPLFADKRVRQAMTQLIDRDQMITKLYFGTAAPASGPFAYGSWARNPNQKPWPYSPPEARAKLEAAGFKDNNGDGTIDKDGKEFVFELQIPAGSPISEQLGSLLQRELERLGVKMNLRQVEFAALAGNAQSGQYEAMTWALTLGVDPDIFPLFHSSQMKDGFNFFGYANPEVDTLLEQGRVEFDLEKRKAIYWRVGELLHEDQPASFILYPTFKWGVNKRFKGISTSPLGLFLHYPGALEWWVPKEQQTH